MRARALFRFPLLFPLAVWASVGASGCSQLPARMTEALPRPAQANPERVFAERSALLIGAYTEKLEACFVPEDATLAGLHRRQDVAEKVAAFYVETDADGLPIKAKIEHVFADRGSLWALWSHATWGGGEWKVWREPGLEHVEPPAARERRRVL